HHHSITRQSRCELVSPEGRVTTVCAAIHEGRCGPADQPEQSTEEGDARVQLAIDVLRWPGVNQAFLFSFFLSTGLALLVIPFSKRRPAGTPTAWGEAMLAAVFVFAVMFVAFGVVPHQWIDHADKDLGWNK